MEMLNGDGETDVAYVKAQITSDDKELRAIVKEVEKESPPSPGKTATTKPSTKGSGSSGSGLPRGRRPKPKVPIPPHAQPQQAMLMEVEDRWSMGYNKAFGGNKPWLAEKKSDWTRKWASDGWEV
jgi:DNA polymerase gamma 1